VLPAVKDYRDLAKRRLARFAFDYLEGGAEDGRALERNRAAYDRVLFAPRILRDVTEVDVSVEVFGRTQRMPVLVGPTGLNGLFFPKADEVLAKAAHKAGVPFIMSTASTSLLEDVRAHTDGDLWLQLYVQHDRRIAEDMMRRAARAGFSTLVLTVDTMVHGKRDHDVKNGFRLPVPLTPRLIADLCTHPRWCIRMLRQGGGPKLVNLAKSAGITSGLAQQAAMMSRQMSMSLCWDDISWLREHWKGHVVVKGMLSVADAVEAKARGADGIVLSNHGGRQLESAPSPLQILAAVVRAVGQGPEIFVDGGVRRGADIAKACAMGAKAVLVGRAPLYGLSARGSRGVDEVLAILRNEFEITLRLIGQPSARRLCPASLCADYRRRLRFL
jgi:(S)-mandelate dehydrogenase